MKKIRSFLAVIALVATLSGFSLQGMGTLANVTSSWHASSSSASSVAGVAFHIKPNGPCAGGGSMDC